MILDYPIVATFIVAEDAPPDAIRAQTEHLKRTYDAEIGKMLLHECSLLEESLVTIQNWRSKCDDENKIRTWSKRVTVEPT